MTGSNVRHSAVVNDTALPPRRRRDFPLLDDPAPDDPLLDDPPGSLHVGPVGEKWWEGKRYDDRELHAGQSAAALAVR